MKKQAFRRNVRLDRMRRADGRRRGLLERVLVGHPIINRTLSNAAKLVLSAMIWPRFVAPYRFALTRHAVVIPGLPSELDGFTILHLTDLHIGKTRKRYLLSVLEKCLPTGEKPPDVIVITGDLIDYHPRSLPEAQEVLGVLAERAKRAGVGTGIVTIFGNHDYHEHSWRHVGPRSAKRTIHRRLAKIVEGAGIRVLRNEAVRIVRPGAAGGAAAAINIVGIEEMWTGLADPGAAFADVDPAAAATIVLQHNPDGIFLLLEFEWELVLCGHSHGGQADFPVLGALYVPMEHREFLRGFFEFPAGTAPGGPDGKTRRMFVSRGIGHSTPIRLRCRPEATVFTLGGSN